jgi:hypothetical protein
VANTPNVNVASTATNPVPITGTVGVAENPARQAVQQQIEIPLTRATQQDVHGTSSIPIPAGKIFVLETAAFYFLLGVETVKLLQIEVTGPLITGGQGVASYALLIPPGVIRGSQALRLYAQPGTNLNIIFEGTGGPRSRAFVSVSGYFVNAQ